MSVNRQTLSIYWQFAKKHKSYMWKIYPFMVIAQFGEETIVPLIIASILTKLARGDLHQLALSRLWPLLVVVVAIEYGGHFIWIRVVRTFWRWQELVMRDLNMEAFDHLSNMSYRFFSNRFGGSLVNQVNKFCGSFERLTDALTWNVFKLIVGVLFTIIVLAPKAPILVVVILVISAIYVPTVWKYRKKQLPLNKRWAESETKRTGQLADTVTNILAVKSFAGESLERQLMQQRVDKVYDNSMATMQMNMHQELITGTIQRSIDVLVIVLSVILAVNGYIAAGVVYLALAYTTGILRRLWDLNNTFRTLTRVFGDASEMTEILNIEPEIKDPENPEVSKISQGSIVFENVQFGYKDNDTDLLFNGLSLSIKPGEKIGLVGLSGGGKTTVTKLILRFVDISGGQILIDGQNIAHLKQRDLRKHIAYVPQEPLMFHRSISDNIRYGRLEASDKEVLAVSKMANAHEFVETLPAKYETFVGERGTKLSGGQRQRIAIARAMLKNAPILLLDEATSALDSESEVLIQDALWKLMEGRTALVIAHRLSTIQKMDRIIVLDKGSIVEEGSHKELVQKNGSYAKLWAHQSGGFLEE